MPIEVSLKKAKTDIEIHPVTIEAGISKCSM